MTWAANEKKNGSDLAVQFVRGTKGPKLLLGGYSYFRNNGNGDRTYWLCSKNRYHKCNARVITKSNTREVIIKNQNHNHDCDPEDSRCDNPSDRLTFESVMNYLRAESAMVLKVQ